MPVQDLESFFEYLENYVSTENKILIVGDFNIPSFHDQSNDSVATLLNQFLALTNLAQLNKVLNDNGRILDLVLSNITDVAVMLHDSPPVKPDKHHPPLLIDILLRTPSTRNFPLCGINRKFNFKLCNFHELYSALFATDWEFLYKIDDTNDACLQFYNKIRVLLERYIPRTSSRKRYYPVWFSSDLKVLIRKKEKALKEYKKERHSQHKKTFDELRALIKHRKMLDFSTYLENVQSSIKNNPKELWSFVRKKKNTTRLPSNMTFKNRKLDNAQQIVNCFAEYFSDNFIINEKIDQNIGLSENNCYVDLYLISE